VTCHPPSSKTSTTLYHERTTSPSRPNTALRRSQAGSHAAGCWPDVWARWHVWAWWHLVRLCVSDLHHHHNEGPSLVMTLRSGLYPEQHGQTGPEVRRPFEWPAYARPTVRRVLLRRCVATSPSRSAKPVDIMKRFKHPVKG
jgi:hypothetical protein